MRRRAAKVDDNQRTTELYEAMAEVLPPLGGKAGR